MDFKDSSKPSDTDVAALLLLIAEDRAECAPWPPVTGDDVEDGR